VHGPEATTPRRPSGLVRLFRGADWEVKRSVGIVRLWDLAVYRRADLELVTSGLLAIESSGSPTAF
jgi:hypothetical protein